MSLPSITIVIPMYNEEDNVAPLFEALEESMNNYDGVLEGHYRQRRQQRPNRRKTSMKTLASLANAIYTY